MDDLISRRAAINALVEKGQSSRRYKLGETWELNCDEINEAIDGVPSAQKPGKWINDSGLYKCTACNDLCTVAGWADCIPEKQMYKAFKFCPNCGARMDGE